MNINWDTLGFGYIPTNSYIHFSYKNGAWSDGELRTEHTITLSVAATGLHYGQTLFEGLKAFMTKDGTVKIFRPDANLKRLNEGMAYILGPEIPEQLFIDGVKKVVKDNIEFVPPYGTGGSLYIRPLAFGSTAQMGVGAAEDYELLILVTPVGAYYKHGLKPVDALLMDQYDRAAPNGTGHIKMGGNYGASLKPSKMAKDKGYPITLFLDAATHSYVEEFGTSNFIGITKDGTYVTPDSPSILNSVTNRSLQRIAKDMGIKVEKRPVPKEELAEFAEVGACGTAVVITPISSITAGDKTYQYGDSCGPVLQKLYDRVRAIQLGESDDPDNWLVAL
jgi:branched-chain amino acid aminotransferase